MKKIVLENFEYELVDNYKDGFDGEALTSRYNDYFYDYDYILGDWAYSKLRLKGFCDKTNKMYNKINDYNRINEYIKDKCAYECKYFIIKKIKNT